MDIAACRNDLVLRLQSILTLAPPTFDVGPEDYSTVTVSQFNEIANQLHVPPIPVPDDDEGGGGATLHSMTYDPSWLDNLTTLFARQWLLDNFGDVETQLKQLPMPSGRNRNIRDRVVNLLGSVMDKGVVVEDTIDDFFLPSENCVEEVEEFLNTSQQVRAAVGNPGVLPEGFRGMPETRPKIVHTIVYYILKSRVEQFVQTLLQAGGGTKVKYLVVAGKLKARQSS